MRSAQRKHRLETKARMSRILPLFLKVILPLVIILGLFTFFKLSTRFWNGRDKLSFVFLKDGGDVGITVLDPMLEEATTITIPGDTQVVLAENYGTMRIKNVWQLGVNEKKERLLGETVMKNFLFPNFLWSSSIGESIGKGDFHEALKFVLDPKSTNISFGDRISLAFFAERVQALNRTVIDLGKSQFLRKQTLSDGESGYVLSGPVSERLTSFFVDSDFSKQNVRVNVVDKTGVYGTADGVGQVIEVLGGKVVSISRADVVSDLDCFVAGKDPRVVKKIVSLFSCQKDSKSSDFDLELTLGGKFAKRY